MISRQRKRELQETVRNALNEFDGGGDGGGDWGGGGGGGFSDYGPSLYKTFLQPFVDVLETSQAAIETATSKVQLLMSVATYAVMSSVLPFVRADYDAMIKHDERRMQSIGQKYAEVYKRTDAALTEVGGNYDGAGVFAILFPHKVLAYNMVKGGASVGEKSVKTLADTAFDFLDAITLNATEGITDPLRKSMGVQESFKRITEDEEKEGPSKEAQIISKVMNHPHVEMEINNSQIIKSMRKDGLDALKGTLEKATEPIKKLKKVNSIQDIESLTGRPIDIPEDALRDAEGNIDEQNLAAAMQDIMPKVIAQAAVPFQKRIKRLHGDFKKMGQQFGASNEATFKSAMKLFEKAVTDLED